MSKIGLAIVVASLAGAAAATHHTGTGGGSSRPVEPGSAIVAPVFPAGHGRAVGSPQWQSREVVWHPDPAAPSPFGFIPTEWDVQPQLLPTTWDVRIVFASARHQR